MSTNTLPRQYELKGTGGQGPNEECIPLQNGKPDSLWGCSFFGTGGKPSQACSAGTFTKPASFNIKGGFCTVYSTSDCTDNSLAPGIDSSDSKGYTDISPTMNLPETWLSLNCFAFPDH